MKYFLLLIASFTLTLTGFSQSAMPQLGADKYLCPEDSLTLNAGLFDSYLWNTGDTTQTLIVSEPGLYSVAVESADGVFTDEVLVLATTDLATTIPNVFTPNGDGENDVFLPVQEISAAATYDLSIFNRYGNLIFHSTKPTLGWNGKTDLGKNHPEGSYFMVVVFDTPCGPQKYSGSLTLLR